MTYDITALRALFPALSAGTAHFDGPGGTQTPDRSSRPSHRHWRTLCRTAAR